jgi:hypothetical protein
MKNSFEMDKINTNSPELKGSNPPSLSSSLDDPDREELLWSNRQNVLLKKWLGDIDNKVMYHKKKGVKMKNLFHSFGIPSVLLPIVLASLSSAFIASHPVVLPSLLMGSGCAGGISQLFNFGKNAQLNEEYSSKYRELGLEITAILAIPKRNRPACDVFLERVKQRFIALENSAPN